MSKGMTAMPTSFKFDWMAFKPQYKPRYVPILPTAT